MPPLSRVSATGHDTYEMTGSEWKVSLKNVAPSLFVLFFSFSSNSFAIEHFHLRLNGVLMSAFFFFLGHASGVSVKNIYLYRSKLYVATVETLCLDVCCRPYQPEFAM